jgi:hypothetical protein
VNIDLSTYDRSCQKDSDCIAIADGQICSGQCACPDVEINVSGQSTYEAAVSSIDTGMCFCPAGPVPQCLDSVCVNSSTPIDAGAPEDSGVCVDIDISTYDQSCEADSDCIEVTGGTVCTDGCQCGGSVINVDGEARYHAAIAPVQGGGGCPCPEDGQPACVHNRCTLCGFAAAACPDGG